MNRLLIICGGALFGAGLAISGMTDPARVIGFLDFTGAWDPALAFVMGGAVATFAAGLLLLRHTGGGKIRAKLPDLSSAPIRWRMVAGCSVFGIGWGLGGFCPGPAIANLATLRTEALIFVPVMLIGMFLAQRVFGLDR